MLLVLCLFVREGSSDRSLELGKHGNFRKDGVEKKVRI